MNCAVRKETMSHMIADASYGERLIHRGKEILGFSFFMRPQKYAVFCSARLSNKGDTPKTFILAMPVPSDLSYQKILSSQYEPEPIALVNDEQFGNRVALWKGICAPRTEQRFSFTSTVSVAPRVGAVPRTSILHRINDYCINHLTYGDPIDGLYSPYDALTRQRVDCGGFCSLFLSLAGKVGIHGELCAGFWAGYPKSTMHAWLEFQSPVGIWIPADPSVEHLRRAGKRVQSGRLGFVGSDRVCFSVGSALLLHFEGKEYSVDILQNPTLLSGASETLSLCSDIHIVRSK